MAVSFSQTVYILGIQQVIYSCATTVRAIPSCIAPVCSDNLFERGKGFGAAFPRFDEPFAGEVFPHFVVAVLVDKVFRLGILALHVLDLYLGGVFLHHIFKHHRLDDGKSIGGEAEAYAPGAVVDVELAAEEQFKFLKVFLHRPVRQGAGVPRRIPRIRERVTDKEIPVFLLILPRGEVVGVAHGLAYPPGDIQKIWLPRQPRGVGVPRIFAVGKRGAVLNVARSVVYPRQGYGFITVLHRRPRIRGCDARFCGGGWSAEVQLVDIYLIGKSCQNSVRCVRRGTAS